jgi:hypothetical protein
VTRLPVRVLPASRLQVRLLLCVQMLLLAMPRAAQAAAVTTAASWASITGHSPLQPPPSVQYGMVADPQGTVFVYGGNGNTGAQSDFWSWDPHTRSWTQLNSAGMPALIEPHLAADSQGAIYEFGGITGTPITDTTTISGTAHVSADGYSYGLYRYDPIGGDWQDLTPPRVQPGISWPLGREDFGFSYDPSTASLWVFAGDGPGAANLNDMWRYSLQTRRWTRIAQHYHDPGGAAIDPREIYNISDDGQGGFYLFGGSYLKAPPGRVVPWPYVNDLWYFTIATATWTLIAGRPNAYDPNLPVPRHYYAQSTDAAGNFYILGGYVSATTSPAYFADDTYSQYANLAVFPGSSLPSGDIIYALADFWRVNRDGYIWTDLTASLGALDNGGFIPYVMVNDPAAGGFCTFGGFHPDPNGILEASSQLWCIRETGAG